jgi:hypothetical protein
MKPSTLFFLIASLLLALVAGAWLWRSVFSRSSTVTVTRWIDRPVTVPPKIITLQGKQILVADTSRQAREDSLIAELKHRDRLDSLARWRGQTFSASFPDTVQAKDSLGTFYLREIHKIDVDGSTQKITKATSYFDGKFRIAFTKTTETVYEIDWLVTSAALVAALIAIFALK